MLFFNKFRGNQFQMINALGSKAFSFWGFTFLAHTFKFLGTDSNGVRQSSCSLQSFSGVC